MRKIPLNIITGFLGSGKTTFIKNILNQFSAKYKIGIVQNEFGPANIDSIDLKATGKAFEILEINRGSVFCVCLLNDFVESLSKFIEQYQPEILFLEATGLSDPITISELTESPLLSDKIYVTGVYSIVDASNFHKLKTNSRVINQIRIADKILVNKIDLFEKTKKELRDSLRLLNPFAPLLFTSYCNINFQELFKNDSSTNRYQSIEGNSTGSGRPEIEAKVLKSHRKFDKNKLCILLSNLDDDLYRVKGYLRGEGEIDFAVQYVYGEFTIIEIKKYQGPYLLTALGNTGSTGKFFKSILSIAS